jgi:flavin-dependent dehydrogenase
MRSDAIVVGGGLSGAATALHLARAGLSVVIVERRRFPRDKPCGEGLLPRGVAKLAAIGLGGAIELAQAQPFRGVLYRCHGVVARGDFADRERGYGLRRILLDDIVRQAACRAGANHLEATVEGVQALRDGAAVELRGGERLFARFVVGADGPHSVVRRACGLDAGRAGSGRYAIRRHFELSSGVPLPERVEVAVLGGCELYVTPVGPRLVGVAALCERGALRSNAGGGAARLRALLSQAPVAIQERLSGARPASEPLACGPLRVRAKRAHRGTVLLTGDAAGYVDAISGEGMGLALCGAELAARAILAVLSGRASGPCALAAYERQRARLLRGHVLLTHGLLFLARHPRLARRAAARLAREPRLFTRLLAVNDGSSSLLSLGILDALKLAVGARPVDLVREPG